MDILTGFLRKIVTAECTFEQLEGVVAKTGDDLVEWRKPWRRLERTLLARVPTTISKRLMNGESWKKK